MNRWLIVGILLLAVSVGCPADPGRDDHRESLRSSLKEELSPRLFREVEPMLSDSFDSRRATELSTQEKEALERLFGPLIRELQKRLDAPGRSPRPGS